MKHPPSPYFCQVTQTILTTIKSSLNKLIIKTCDVKVMILTQSCGCKQTAKVPVQQTIKKVFKSNNRFKTFNHRPKNMSKKKLKEVNLHKQTKEISWKLDNTMK